jgi:hypothetical protein
VDALRLRSTSYPNLACQAAHGPGRFSFARMVAETARLRIRFRAIPHSDPNSAGLPRQSCLFSEQVGQAAQHVPSQPGSQRDVTGRHSSRRRAFSGRRARIHAILAPSRVAACSTCREQRPAASSELSSSTAGSSPPPWPSRLHSLAARLPPSLIGAQRALRSHSSRAVVARQVALGVEGSRDCSSRVSAPWPPAPSAWPKSPPASA